MDTENRITEVTDVSEAINEALAKPEKPPASLCIGCGSTRVTMSLLMIATTRNCSPRVSRNTRAMALCSECCNPESPSYASLGSILCVQVFSLRNMVFEKVAEAWRESKGQ
jgi:hypothetical protein